MPGRARKDIFDPTTVGVYHCYNRCVRKAFLCGSECEEGQDHGHRQEWIRQRLEGLASVFGIDVATHSMMDNHMHVVLRNRPDVVREWSDEEVVRRWLRLDAKRLALRPASADEVRQSLRDAETVAKWRGKLSDISEFMRMLDEPVARAANAEDDVRGHFWEERFKCQRLLDEASVLACSIDVDLNPIRAMLAQTPETSLYTSADERIQDLPSQTATTPTATTPTAADATVALMTDTAAELALEVVAEPTPASTGERSGWLAPMNETGDGYAGVAAGRRASDQGILPLTSERYLELLDWTGRQVRGDKAGAIPQHLAPILDRLGIQTGKWLEVVSHFGRWFGHVAGRAAAVIEHARETGHQRWGGTGRCREAFG